MKRLMPFAVAGLLLISSAGRVRADNPVLTTEDFENQTITMADASDSQLQSFLSDLQSRRDYDAQCHDGKPGPDADYLTGWIEKSVTELKTRGYAFDENGRPKQ